MAYDAARGATVLFGGHYRESGDHYLGDTWEWNGSTWTLRSSSGPPSRENHALAYDAARGVTVLFGGYYYQNGNNYFGDTWEWNGITWTIRPNGGPSPRYGHAMSYDGSRGITVLFGGYNGSLLGDIWESNGDTWTLRSASGPSPRRWHAMTYDVARGVSVLFGGNIGNSNITSPSGETWEYRGRPLPSPTPGALDADRNTDGKLNGLDIQPFVNAMLSAPSDPTNVYIADFNISGSVDPADVDPFVSALLSSAP
jgi:hypothetical protein